MNKNIILYAAILVFGIAAPFILPAFKVQLSILCVLIVLALTWNIQGGEMGYNSFGNILFYGLGMYLCASVQVGMFFPLAEWTESGGEKTFIHTPTQFFQGMAAGLVVAAVVPAIVAGLIGYSILGLRGHYFAICTLGLGVAAGEISGGIEIIGAGQGFTTPPYPDVGSLEARGEFFYYLSFMAVVLTFITIKSIYSTRFKLVLNAIRDNEDKAEAMGIQTMKYKIIGWMISAFFCGLAGGIMGGLIGYSILGLRGHYFAICTLGLGVAAGEISGGIENIGAGQGFTTPPYPDVGSLESRGEFFYYLSFMVVVLTFITVKSIYSTRFKLVLNAIRDNEDKAEARGIQTMKYKIIGWMISAFFCGLAGGIMGGLVGYIDSTDVAFDGREMGVFMVLMAILGGKGTLWGPIIGATVFHIFKEGFWTFFLGWQYVALGVLIVVIVIYFPEGIMGWLREKYPERFGEVVDEADRKAQLSLIHI